MMNKGRQLKTGILLNYVNLILGNLIPIFYTPIMLDLLGQSEYGLYKLSANVTSYLELVALGIGAAVTRYLIKARSNGGIDAERRMFGLFMIIFQFIAITSLMIGLLLIGNLDNWYRNALSENELIRMQVIVGLMVCNTALSFSLSPYVSITNSHEKFVFMQGVNIVSTCLGPTLNLIVLFFGYKSIAMAVISLTLNVIIRFLYLVYVHGVIQIKPNFRGMPIQDLKEILAFSLWIFLGNIVGQLYNATDTVLIGAVPSLGTNAVAVYNIGLTFNTIVLSLTTAASNLLAPKVNKMVFDEAGGKALTDLAIKVGRLQMFVMGLLVGGFLSFGKPFISFYVGPGYMDAYFVALLMMIPNMIPLAQSVCSSIVVAQNKHQFRSGMYLIIAVINVIGTWFLLQHWGIIGAAFMTGLGLILGQGFAMNWFYANKTGIDIRRFWKEIINVFWCPVILCVFTNLFSKFIDFYSPISLIIGILTFAIFYCGASMRFVMNDYERSLILSIVNKIIKRE